MRSVKKKIQTLMDAEHQSQFSIFGSFLFLLSLGYGTAVNLRTSGYKKDIFKSQKLPLKVISVGNITVGGTGKTPLTVHMTQRIQRLGYKIAVISRGYKGLAERSGAVVSNGRDILLEPSSAGDEPFMMANQLKDIGVPVLVGQDRYQMGLMAVNEFKPDVIILDDGFQHLNLKRDINLVLLDCQRPFGNKHLLPRGPLREPLSSLARANAFILTRCNFYQGETNREDLAILEGYAKGSRIFRASHVPVLYKWLRANQTATDADGSRLPPCELATLKGKNVFAFSGIADNNVFKITLEKLQCELKGFLGFPDHHFYSRNDFVNIFSHQRSTEADIICTTEKDYVRISNEVDWPIDLAVIGVELSFGEDDDNFYAFIKKRLE